MIPQLGMKDWKLNLENIKYQWWRTAEGNTRFGDWLSRWACFLLIFKILFWVYDCLPLCVSETTYILGAFRGQNRALGPLELLIVMSHHVGSGSWTWVFWKEQPVLLTDLSLLHWVDRFSVKKTIGKEKETHKMSHFMVDTQIGICFIHEKLKWEDSHAMFQSGYITGVHLCNWLMMHKWNSILLLQYRLLCFWEIHLLVSPHPCSFCLRSKHDS